MPSPESPHTQLVDPLAPVAHLAGGVAHVAVEVALGWVIGTALAVLMRQAQLRWSWAATGLVIVVLAEHSPEATATSTLSITMLTATLLGRRWHRQDVVAGADLAAIAAERRGPTAVLRSCAGSASLYRRRRAVDSWFRGDDLILGRDDRHRPVSVRCGGLGDGAHTLVVGSTGSGKTVTQTWIATRAIEHGMGTVVVDPKGDGAMRAALVRAAGSRTAFVEWTPDGPSVYNPYARGSETQIADKVLAGERFTEPHYLRQAQRYMGYTVRALRRSGLEVSLQRIVDHLRPSELELLARSLPEAEAARTHDYLDSLTPRQQSDLGGVRDRLAILAESDVGPWLDPETPGADQFDLLEAIVGRTVVYFNLEADTRPLLAQMLAAAIVQDLQAAVANLQGRPLATLVVIDEFSAVAAEHVVRLFGRARSAGVSLLLGTQELSDLRLPGRDNVLEQVMGNLSTLIAHRQVVPDSAQLIARLAGTKGAWRGTQREDGPSSRTRTRVGHLEQDDVMRLGRGRAVVIPLTGGRAGAARTTRVFTP